MFPYLYNAINQFYRPYFSHYSNGIEIRLFKKKNRLILKLSEETVFEFLIRNFIYFPPSKESCHSFNFCHCPRAAILACSGQVPGL